MSQHTGRLTIQNHPSGLGRVLASRIGQAETRDGE